MLLLLHTLALLRLLLLLLLLPPAPKIRAVVSLVPLPEGIGVDLHDSGLSQSIRTHELVVRRMEGDGNDTDFAGDALAAPGEVAGVEAQGAELAVAAAGTDEMDTLAADTGVGRLATFLEGPVVLHIRLRCLKGRAGAIGLCIPLLAIVCALCTGGAALVTRVTRDTINSLATTSKGEYGNCCRLYPMIAVGEDYCEQELLACHSIFVFATVGSEKWVTNAVSIAIWAVRLTYQLSVASPAQMNMSRGFRSSKCAIQLEFQNVGLAH